MRSRTSCEALAPARPTRRARPTAQVRPTTPRPRSGGSARAGGPGARRSGLDPAQRRLDDRLTRVAECGADGARIAASFTAIAGHACAAWADPPERRPAELLLELELALLLIEAWARLAEIHAIVSTHD